MLKEVLDTHTSVVLSTGGGTQCYANNMETILQQSDHSIYLNHSIPVLVERITKEKEHRPLVKNIPDHDLPEFVGKHLFERRPYYMQAEHRVDCDPLSPEEVVGEINKLL